jgi:hypothetical protein
MKRVNDFLPGKFGSLLFWSSLVCLFHNAIYATLNLRSLKQLYTFYAYAIIYSNNIYGILMQFYKN